MKGGFMASPPSPSPVICLPRVPSKLPIKRCTTALQSWNSLSNRDQSLFSWDLKFTENGSPIPSRISLRCNSSTKPGGPSDQGENDSRSVLDAFFLGKALAESVSERIESAVGEFLSTIGRLQAEQQKQVLDFQEEVLEKARRAKEKAAREAMEAQGLIPKSSARNMAPPVTNGTAASAAQSDTGVQPSTTKPNLADEDPVLGASGED